MFAAEVKAKLKEQIRKAESARQRHTSKTVPRAPKRKQPNPSDVDASLDSKLGANDHAALARKQAQPAGNKLTGGKLRALAHNEAPQPAISAEEILQEVENHFSTTAGIDAAAPNADGKATDSKAEDSDSSTPILVAVSSSSESDSEASTGDSSSDESEWGDALAEVKQHLLITPHLPDADENLQPGDRDLTGQQLLPRLAPKD